MGGRGSAGLDRGQRPRRGLHSAARTAPGALRWLRHQWLGAARILRLLGPADPNRTARRARSRRVPAVLRLLEEPHPTCGCTRPGRSDSSATSSIGSRLVDLRPRRRLAHGEDDRRVARANPVRRARAARSRWWLKTTGIRPFVRSQRRPKAAFDGQHSSRTVGPGAPRTSPSISTQLPFERPAKLCDRGEPSGGPDDEDHFDADRSPEQAKRFSYKRRADAFDGVEDSAEVVWIDQVPRFGTRASGGWFLGAARGEWGGELVWRPIASAISSC